MLPLWQRFSRAGSSHLVDAAVIFLALNILICIVNYSWTIFSRLKSYLLIWIKCNSYRSGISSLRLLLILIFFWAAGFWLFAFVILIAFRAYALRFYACNLILRLLNKNIIIIVVFLNRFLREYCFAWMTSCRTLFFSKILLYLIILISVNFIILILKLLANY